MRRLIFVVVSALAAGWLSMGTAFAQGGGGATTGSITGRVSDASGGVLPGVTVVAKSPSLMGVQTLVTDAGGNYRFPALPPGTYAVRYDLPASTRWSARTSRITIGFTATRERDARSGVGRGDRDRHRPVAGHRHELDPRAAEYN